jgi:hypothetical protein
MSAYQVNKIIYLTDNDPDFRREMKENAEAVIDRFRLTEEEREALLGGRIARLRELGVHTFLLNHIARYELFGVNRENYLERIREGMPYDPRFELSSMPMQYFVQR